MTLRLQLLFHITHLVSIPCWIKPINFCYSSKEVFFFTTAQVQWPHSAADRLIRGKLDPKLFSSTADSETICLLLVLSFSCSDVCTDTHKQKSKFVWFKWHKIKTLNTLLLSFWNIRVIAHIQQDCANIYKRIISCLCCLGFCFGNSTTFSLMCFLSLAATTALTPC